MAWKQIKLNIYPCKKKKKKKKPKMVQSGHSWFRGGLTTSSDDQVGRPADQPAKIIYFQLKTS